MPVHVSHHLQLRKSRIEWCKSGWPTSKPDLAGIRRQMERAEPFLFTALPAVEDQEEIRASVEAMQAADVWRLPYPVCTFEFRALLALKDVPEGVAAITQQRPEGEVFIAVLDESAAPHFVTEFFLRASDRAWIACMVDGDIRRTEPDHEPMHLSDGKATSTVTDMVHSCLVLLHTRGIERERWIGDQRVKPHLIGRNEPRNAYTRVMVREAAERQGDSHTSGDTRHRVRLHLRRGHTRQQHHGRGRTLTKAIWIEPTLVGYREEGEVRHAAYIQEGRS